MFIEILFKMLLFKGGVLIYAEHCIYIYFFFLRIQLVITNIQHFQKFKLVPNILHTHKIRTPYLAPVLLLDILVCRLVDIVKVTL